MADTYQPFVQAQLYLHYNIYCAVQAEYGRDTNRNIKKNYKKRKI